MKKIELLNFILLLVVLCSCTNDNDFIFCEKTSENNVNLLSQVQIKQMLDNMNSLEQLTKSTDAVNYSEMSSYEIQCTDTVSQCSENITITQCKVINQDKEGYAIILNDNRFPVVLAYVPHGNMSDTAKIEPLNMFFRDIPAIVKDFYNQSKQTKSARSLAFASALNEVKTKWHDSHPYNKKIPTGSSIHPNAGTHVSSIAQLCAYFKKGAYNWSTLLSSPTISPEETGRVDLVSSLYLDIFNKTKTEYVSGEPVADIKNVIGYLHDLGFKGADQIVMRDLTWAKSQIYTDLKNGGVIIMNGVRYVDNKRFGVDYWLVDGCNVYLNNGDLDFSSPFYHLHCNWGQSGGLSNGYFSWFPNGNLLTTGTVGYDNNSYRSINAILGIKK